MGNLVAVPMLLAAVVVSRWLSAADPDPLASLTQYGPLGLMVLGFLTGWIVPGPTAKAQAAEITRLQTLFEHEVLPMAKTYAETMGQVTTVLEKVLVALTGRSDP